MDGLHEHDIIMGSVAAVFCLSTLLLIRVNGKLLDIIATLVQGRRKGDK